MYTSKRAGKNRVTGVSVPATAVDRRKGMATKA
jgi:hypothetical protein